MFVCSLSFVSETVLQNSIFRIITKRYQLSLVYILPIITTLHISNISRYSSRHKLRTKIRIFYGPKFLYKMFFSAHYICRDADNMYRAVGQLVEALGYKA